MSQLDYNHGSIVLGGLSVVISFFVGGIVAWYTWETHRLRKATDEQVRLLTDQIHALVAPFLTLIHERYMPAQIDQVTKRVLIRECYECDIVNQTDRLAYHVSVIIRNKTAIYSGHVEFVGPHAGTRQDAPLVGVIAKQNSEAFSEVRRAYGDACAQSLEQVRGAFAAIVFRDMRGDVGLLERPVDLLEADPTLLYRIGPPVQKWF
jgi:hypothetical protein